MKQQKDALSHNIHQHQSANFDGQNVFKYQNTKQKVVNFLKESIGIFTFMNFKKQLKVANGIVISANLVLTSAHNIFDHIRCQEYLKEKNTFSLQELRKFQLNKNTFRFHLNTIQGKHKQYQIEDWRFPQEFMECPRVQYNFAVIKLKEMLNYKKLNWQYFCENCFYLQNKQLKIVSYSMIKQLQIQKGLNFNFKNYEIFEDKRKDIFKKIIVNYQSSKIEYEISAVKEDAGCPIIIDDKIVGIHCGGSINQKINVGILIQYKIMYIIMYWKSIMSHDNQDYLTKICQKHQIWKFNEIEQIKNINGIKQNIIVSNLNKYFIRFYDKNVDIMKFHQLIKIKMPMLSALYLNQNKIENLCCKHLAFSDWKRLCILDLCINLYQKAENEIEDAGCSYLIQSDWKQLMGLNLNQNKISTSGCLYLSQSKWQNLIRLEMSKIFRILDNNKIGNIGCKYLSKGNWKKLISLQLNSNQINDNGCLHLSKAEWRYLNFLFLHHNFIYDIGCMNIIQGDWKNLKICSLNRNKIRNTGFEKLMIGNWNNLQKLNLKQSNFFGNSNITIFQKANNNKRYHY